MRRRRLILLIVLLCAGFGVLTACFSADHEPRQDSRDDDVDDDDTNFPVDDDAGDDDAGDDDAGDDDTDDDADDDSGDDDTGDDDTAVTVSCDDILAFVYDDCGDAFADKGSGDRLTRTEAAGECGPDSGYWQCVQSCLDTAGATCSGLIDCVNADCAGPLELQDVPA